MHWEVGVCAADASDKVIFERLDGTFCSISTVDMRWDKLEIHMFRGEEGMKAKWLFIVHVVELKGESSSCEDLVN